MTDYKKYINALRKCAKEHDGDKTFTGQVIVSDLCKDTANLLEELSEYETVSKESYDHEYFLRKKFEIKIARLEQSLGKIKAEIEALPIAFTSSFEMKQDCLGILEKYKSESEPKRSEDKEWQEKKQ